MAEDEWKFVLLFWMSHNLTYYGWSVPLSIAYDNNMWVYWKIQPDKYPEKLLVKKANQDQILLRICLHPFIWFFMYRYIIIKKLSDPLPSFGEMLFQVVASFYGFFIINMLLHRAMHMYPFLYQYHKDHHAFKTTTGIAAEHHHIFDSIANAIPTFVPPYVLGLHPLLWCVHMFFRTWESVDTHSGYALPFTPFRYLPGLAYQQEYHSYHHHTNKGTYSCLCFDHITGADECFLKSIDRNFVGALTYGYFGGRFKSLSSREHDKRRK